MHILDTLGVMLAGTETVSSKMVVSVVTSLGGKAESTIIGHGSKTSCTNAALANGTIGHALEMDDAHRSATIHPGVCVIPAGLAMAERENIDGKSFLTSVVVGYEVACRLGEAFLGLQYYEGFHPTGTCGTFGAAAAAAKAMDLREEAIVRALGIAGSMAAGLEEWKADGSWIKRMNAGHAAQSGVLAALLAHKGYTAPATILEGRDGFLKAFSFERKWDMNKIVHNLGQDFRGYLTDFKPYSCCRFSHPVIDATLELIQKHDIGPQDVEEVNVEISGTAKRTLFEPKNRRYRPRTIVDAQFSIPYAVAVTIIRRKAMPSEFTEESILNPKILALASRVRGTDNPAYQKLYPEKWPTTVTIETKDGKKYSQYAESAKGDPSDSRYTSNPELFYEDIREKFKSLISTKKPYSARINRMIDLVNNLEKHKVVKLAELFRP